MRHAIEKIKLTKKLRKTGHTLGEIIDQVKLPKTTIWHHIKDISISPKYTRIFAKKQATSIVRSSREWDKARLEAKNFIPQKFDVSTAALLASAIYWGEGSKRDFNLANSDPDLVRLFMRCMRKFGISPRQFALHVRIYDDLNPDTAVKYWLSVTKIPRSNVVKVEVLKGRKNGKLPYGMCRVRLYKGAYQLKLLTAIKEHMLKLS